MRALAEKLKERNIPFFQNVPTAGLCTFRIGGNCPLVIEPRTEGELLTAIKLCRETDTRFLPLGRGSNVLFPDADLRYVLLRTIRLRAVQRTDSGLVAECGVPLPQLAAMTAAWGFEDLLFLCGIPGTLGGGVFMNAGAHGEELGNAVFRVDFLNVNNLEKETYFNEELGFSYRKSIFKQKNWIILRIWLNLKKPCDPSVAKAKMRALLAARRAAQPIELPSAGSAFRRPAPDLAMGKLLDEMGLKGLRQGGAEVSIKHAGFIVNSGGARAADVKALITEIQKMTKKQKGFSPEPEICFFPEEL